MFTPTLLAPLAAAVCCQTPLPAAGANDAAAAYLAAAQTAPAEPSDLHISLTPGVWLARLGGDVKLGPSPAAETINLETDFNLDDLETAFNFELALTKGEHWQVDASGFDFSTSAREAMTFAGVFGPITFAPGDVLDSSFDMTSAALDVSYWQWHPINSTKGDTSDLRFAYGGGVRWFSVKQRVELVGSAAPPVEADGEWLVPEVVLQMDFHHDLPKSFPVLDAFEVMASGSFGPAIGGDGGIVATLRANIRGWICHNFSLDFGYRLLEASVENRDYELTGGLQGLFLSATFRF